MGRQSIYLQHVDDDLKAINPSCMWGLMKAVDYHQWGYSVKGMLPYKGNHIKGYQIPKYVCDEQQHTLIEDEEKKKKKKNLTIDHVAKKNGSSTKKRSIKSRLKSLLANHKTKEVKRKKSKLQRTYSIHHLGYEDHDLEEKLSDWDHPIIFIPSKKEVNDEESGENFLKSKEDDEFVNVLDMFKVDERLFLEIMKNPNDGNSKTSMKLMKSGSFPGTKSSSFKPSKLKDKQTFLKWEKFPDVVVTSSFKDESRVNIGSIKHGKSLSLILANRTESDQEDYEEEEERRSGVKFSHKRSISLNESMDKYVNLFGNDFKKEGNLHQSRSLRLKIDQDEIKPRLFSSIGSLSNVDWPVTFSEEISSYTNEDLVDNHTYDVDDLARFRTESFSGESCFRVKDLVEQYIEEDRTGNNTDELQESCMMSVSENSFQSGIATIDDFKYVQGVENKCDDNIDHTVNTDDQGELEYIRHILEFSGINKNSFQWKWQSSDNQPLKPCLFDEACRAEDLERFTEDLRSFYYYQLLFDLINEELVCLNDRLSTYYPKALSYSCHVRVLPVGNRVVEEIISSGVSKLLNFKPEEKPSLDSIVDFDLKKDDENWMNLQWESESVALEVDHMIFEDLLKELFC